MKYVILYALINVLTISASAGELSTTTDCHAAFDVVVDPLNPLKINFIDRSSGQISRWQWSFGDGSTAEGQHQVHTYPGGGTYFVCLTVSNSQTGFICNDVLCLAVTIHESGKCIADYRYTVDGQNNLKVQFNDTSSGNVTSWHWNFGDGSVSGEQNPEHIFPGNGKYLVCLTAYNPDSISICQNTKCDSIDLSQIHPCQADFSWVLDSLNPLPNTFIFTNQSSGNPTSWSWNTGDGAVYSSKDISHRFLTTGLQHVCLKIFREVSGSVICTDSICKEVPTASYLSLGGHLFTGVKPINNPVSTGDTGVLYLFREKNITLVPVDTLLFTHMGYFAFPSLLSGSYLARAGLTSGSANYGKYFPTYFPHNLSWMDNCSFLLQDSSRYAAHIHLITAADMASGPCTLIGTVMQTWSTSLPGELPNADVLLFNGDMMPFKFTVSRSNGSFELNGLPFGFYYLKVEVPGFYSRTTGVWLDESTPHISNILLEVFDHDVTGFEDPGDADLLNCQLFPNPSTGDVYLEIESEQADNLILSIYSSAGIRVGASTIYCPQGHSRIKLPVSHTAKGISFILVRTADYARSASLKMIRY